MRAHRGGRGIAPKFHTLSADHPRTDRSWGSVNLIPFFHIFLFSIPFRRYAPGGEKIFFLRVFIDADDVQAPMRHPPRGRGGGGGEEGLIIDHRFTGRKVLINEQVFVVLIPAKYKNFCFPKRK